jgi:hypothetical protein
VDLAVKLRAQKGVHRIRPKILEKFARTCIDIQKKIFYNSAMDKIVAPETFVKLRIVHGLIPAICTLL